MHLALLREHYSVRSVEHQISEQMGCESDQHFFFFSKHSDFATWASHLTSLNFSYLFCKMVLVLFHISQDFHEDKMRK